MTLNDALTLVRFICESIIVFFARFVRLTQKSREKFHTDGKPLWYAVKRYVVYIFSPNDGLMEKILNDLDRLKPTPYEIDNKYLPIVYIDQPDDINAVLNNSNALEKGHGVDKFAEDVFGKSLGLTTATRWKKQRRLISPAFHDSAVESYMAVFNATSRKLAKNLEESTYTGGEIDLWDHVSLSSFDTVLETMMGFKADDAFTRENKRCFLDNVKSLTTVYAYRNLHLWLRCADLIFKTVAMIAGWRRLRGELVRIASKIIRHRQRMLLKRKLDYALDESTKKDEEFVFLARLLTAFQSGSTLYTGKELTQEVLFMMIAGVEPISITNCFTLLMLAMHPRIQEEVYVEVVEILGVDGDEKQITIEDADKMHVLDRCIKETLRLYPVVPLIARSTTGNIQLSSGQQVKSGTTLVFSPFCVHRKREFYENASTWDPDRFLSENVKKRHSCSFIPFSGGPRACLGARYAILSMKVALATIVKKYRLSTDSKISDVKLKFDLLLRSVAGWRIRLRSRRQ